MLNRGQVTKACFIAAPGRQPGCSVDGGKALVAVSVPICDRSLMLPFTIHCSGPVLAAEFQDPQNILSWSLTRPGFVRARSVAWLEVRNDDLTLDVDPALLLQERLAEAGFGEAVQMMTSRSVKKHHIAMRRSGDARAACLATVGLSNAGRVGELAQMKMPAGTINLLVHIDRPLSVAAHIEAMSIAAEARTAAIMELGLEVGGRAATGTGTDCIAVSAPCGQDAEKALYAGLHTPIGAALGGAVYDAVSEGGRLWMKEQVF
ncbi:MULTISPECIES: adenosylcobinamide amidohydrolase [unclassified Ochrobactrum]|uniref:adenosylcobinamide amidohydrolase n=1 Tax=unclassified Ochrobactrum TaxID=239106 RepID=UPI0025705585|nr:MULTISPECIES: adenosylcobinamide amidohydrolase [unclassified Ochrobactrum]